MAKKQASLKTKTVSGVTWSLLDNLSNQGVVFLIGLVLARILTPHDYGQIGIITIFISIFNSLVESGFSSALIRNPKAKDTDYNTVFWFNVVFSIFLYGVFYLIAPLITHFFEQQESFNDLLRAMGVVIIVNGFSIVQHAILIKHIDFKRQMKISLAASSSGGAVGITMAFCGFGVWSLVAQQITRQVVNSALLWQSSKLWRPRFEFSKRSFIDMFNFGWKMLVTGLLTTIWEEIYQATIGKLFKPEVLGQFTRANQYRHIFSKNITQVVQRVTFPVLSQIQDDLKRLRISYRKIIKMLVYIELPLMLGLFAVAHPLMYVLVGPNWDVAAGYLQIICFSGIFNPLSKLNMNMLTVRGKSGLLLISEIIKKVVATVPVFVGIFTHQIELMLWTSVAANFVCYLINAYFGGREISYTVGQQLFDILPFFVMAAVMAAVVYPISFLSFSPFLILPIQLVVGVVCYILISKIFKVEELGELIQIIRNYTSRLKKK